MLYWNVFRNQHYHQHGVSLNQLSSGRAILLAVLTLLSVTLRPVSAIHHLEYPPLHLVPRQDSDLPLIVTNNCEETVYPAILTQGGTGPDLSGFRLDSGGSLSQNVSASWRGRVWGRTNCTFDEDGNVPSSGQGGTACATGDCGSFVECPGAVSRTSLSSVTAINRNTDLFFKGEPSCHVGRIHIRLVIHAILLRSLPCRRLQPAHGHHLHSRKQIEPKRHPS